MQAPKLLFLLNSLWPLPSSESGAITGGGFLFCLPQKWSVCPFGLHIFSIYLAAEIYLFPHHVLGLGRKGGPGVLQKWPYVYSVTYSSVLYSQGR